jgi:ribosomal protein S24E
VIDGPDSNDLFKIEFRNTQTLSESDVKQRIAQLEQEKAVVNFVGREF